MRLIDEEIRTNKKLSAIVENDEKGENALLEELLGKIQSHLRYVDFAKYPDKWLRALKDDIIRGSIPSDLSEWFQVHDETFANNNQVTYGVEELVLRCYRRLTLFMELTEALRKIRSNYQSVVAEEGTQETPAEIQGETQEGTAEPAQAEPEIPPSTDPDLRATD